MKLKNNTLYKGKFGSVFYYTGKKNKKGWHQFVLMTATGESKGWDKDREKKCPLASDYAIKKLLIQYWECLFYFENYDQLITDDFLARHDSTELESYSRKDYEDLISNPEFWVEHYGQETYDAIVDSYKEMFLE